MMLQRRDDDVGILAVGGWSLSHGLATVRLRLRTVKAVDLRGQGWGAELETPNDVIALAYDRTLSHLSLD